MYQIPYWCFTFIISSKGGKNYPHFIDEETGAQRGQQSCSKSHSKELWSGGLNCRRMLPEPLLLPIWFAKDRPLQRPPRHSTACWYSPSQQLDFDPPQEGVTSLDDQPRVAGAVHGQPDLGCDVDFHGDVQEANETGGDHGARETESTPASRQLGPAQTYLAPRTLTFRPLPSLPLAITPLLCPLLISRGPKPEDFPGQVIREQINLCPPSVCESFKGWE